MEVSEVITLSRTEGGQFDREEGSGVVGFLRISLRVTSTYPEGLTSRQNVGVHLFLCSG